MVALARSSCGSRRNAKEEDMRGVLTTLALTGVFVFALFMSADIVLAGDQDPDPEPEVQGIEIPDDPPETLPLDDDTGDGDPDDIGGGFRGFEGAPLGNHEDEAVIELEALLTIIERLMWRDLR
jgi:hypothetical protein